jgi:hypothetical protein
MRSVSTSEKPIHYATKTCRAGHGRRPFRYRPLSLRIGRLNNSAIEYRAPGNSVTADGHRIDVAECLDTLRGDIEVGGEVQPLAVKPEHGPEYATAQLDRVLHNCVEYRLYVRR